VLNTPLWASDISPGTTGLPPPTSIEPPSYRRGSPVIADPDDISKKAWAIRPE